MTSNDAPTPPPARRRVLGRGPGAAPPPRTAPGTGGREPAARPAHGTPAEPPPDAGAAGTPGGRTSGGRTPAERSGSPEPDPGPRPGPDAEPAAGAEPDADGAPPSAGENGGDTGADTGGGAGDRNAVPQRHAPPPAGTAATRRPAATADPGDGPGPGPDPGGAPRPDAGDGDAGFTVRLANFEGPFDLLLQLISKHKLDVTEVALSKVTDEFMAHIRSMGADWDLDETTEFLVVAATLLDLKAARLLPAAEVEDEADLALLEARDLLFARLLQYRAYKQIAEILDRRLDDEARRYPRTVGLEPQYAQLLPDVVIGIGPERFARLAVKAMQPRPRPQVYVDHIHAPLVSVQEQAGIVVTRLRELGEASFRTLIDDTDDILTVVARFLALLELYREKAVALDQETALGELTVRWTGGDGEGTPVVTDEFDRPPEEPGAEPGKPRTGQEETA
ncbi:segregation/condensation protein A [Streptomyces sp. NPDC047000]|uniref:segregation and condensation protein A n=1 Tax=Streptomyces sp. NPDC047000 TaxID=3155474 RepID=UPI00340F064C